MKRLFLAVELSLEVVERLVVLQQEIDKVAGEAANFRWVAPENIHLTLKFFGEVEPAAVTLIRETVDNLGKPLFPFDIGCTGLGCFPTPDKARVLWAGVDAKGAEVMGLLHQAIERDLSEIGFPPDPREFRPHVSLGRPRSQSAADMSKILADYGALEFGQSFVRDFVLFESQLTPKGPRYEVVSRHVLGER